MLLCLLVMASCSEKPVVSDIPYNNDSNLPSMNSGAAVENQRYSLYWDDQYKAILLYDKNTNVCWSSTPYEYYLEMSEYPDATLSSHITVSYIEEASNQLKVIDSYNGAVINGRISCQKIAKGIEVTYFFDELKISIPVQYLLTDKGMEARIIVNRISEGKERVYDVSLLPYLASVKGDTKNSYLFVPSGSGALMYTDVGDRDMRVYSEETYGEELSKITYEKFITPETVRLPVFGAKAGDNALFGIVSKGAGSSTIFAQAGSYGDGYSQVGVTFRIRGRDIIEIPDLVGRKVASDRFSAQRVDTDYMSVLYHPLYGEDATYAGMAKEYARYLTEVEHMNNNAANPPLYIEFLGGALSTKQFLGIPYKTLNVATTFEDVEIILKDVMDTTGVKPFVKLSGFGESGLDIGKVSGNYRFGKGMGGVNGLRALSKFCTAQKIPLFMDFDLMQFSKSGNGFSIRSQGAYGANNIITPQYRFAVNSLGVDESSERYVLLQRGLLAKSANKLLRKSSKLALPGVSFTTLSSKAYSDYSNRRYFAKNQMDVDVTAIYESFKKSGHEILADQANDYAATKANYIAGSPTRSSGYASLDLDVPFYQMVFKGYIPLAVSPINLAEEPEVQYLKAIETGSALSFTVTNTFDFSFVKSSFSGFLASLYKDLKPEIQTKLEKSADYLQKVQNAKITAHRTIANGVTETTFDNGVKSYVNYNPSVHKIPDGTIIPPRDFVYME